MLTLLKLKFFEFGLSVFHKTFKKSHKIVIWSQTRKSEPLIDISRDEWILGSIKKFWNPKFQHQIFVSKSFLISHFGIQKSSFCMLKNFWDPKIKFYACFFFKTILDPEFEIHKIFFFWNPDPESKIQKLNLEPRSRIQNQPKWISMDPKIHSSLLICHFKNHCPQKITNTFTPPPPPKKKMAIFGGGGVNFFSERGLILS